MKISRLFKAGTSVAIYFTKEMQEALGVGVSDYVKIEISDGKLIVTKVD